MKVSWPDVITIITMFPIDWRLVLRAFGATWGSLKLNYRIIRIGIIALDIVIRVRKSSVLWSQIANTNINVCTIYKATGPRHGKTCLMPYANNKAADGPAHPRSLISAFVSRCLDSTNTKLVENRKSTH